MKTNEDILKKLTEMKERFLGFHDNILENKHTTVVINYREHNVLRDDDLDGFNIDFQELADYISDEIKFNNTYIMDLYNIYTPHTHYRYTDKQTIKKIIDKITSITIRINNSYIAEPIDVDTDSLEIKSGNIGIIISTVKTHPKKTTSLTSLIFGVIICCFNYMSILNGCIDFIDKIFKLK